MDDNPVGDLTYTDAIAYAEWWRGRVVTDELTAKTANKDLGQINQQLKEVSIRELCTTLTVV